MTDDTAYSGDERPPATTTVRSEIIFEGNRKLGRDRSLLSGAISLVTDALDRPKPKLEPQPVADDDKYTGLYLVPPLEDDGGEP